MIDDYLNELAKGISMPEVTTETKSSAFLTVKVDIDCKLYCDGDFLDLFEANKVKKIPIPIGQHLITIESEHVEGITKDVPLEMAEEGKNYLVLVNDLKRKEEIIFNEKVAEELVNRGILLFESKSYKSACDCFYESATKYSNAIAQRYLGEIYYRGLDTESNVFEAIKWYELSANQGDEESIRSLGHIYYWEPICKDTKKAIKWYTIAAENGNGYALYKLGDIYSDWTNDKFLDYKKSFDFYCKAVAQGYVFAYNALGHAYWHGMGTEINLFKARDCLRKYLQFEGKDALTEMQLEIIEKEINDLSDQN